jgi:hypothetical protein
MNLRVQNPLISAAMGCVNVLEQPLNEVQQQYEQGEADFTQVRGGISPQWCESPDQQSAVEWIPG